MNQKRKQEASDHSASLIGELGVLLSQHHTVHGRAHWLDPDASAFNRS